MLSLFSLGLSLLQAKALTVACWVSVPEPDRMVLSCGLAVDGKVVNAVSTDVMEVHGDIDPNQLAAGFCQGVFAVMGARPPVQHEI